MATRTITTRIALDGEQEFKKQLAGINSELKTQKSEMQLLEAQFKGQANTTEALTEKDRLLRKEIEQQEEKVKALEQAVEDATEAYGEADKRTDGYRQSLNRAQRELIEMNRELDDTVKYLEEAKDSSDGAAKSIDGFGKEVKDVDGAEKTIGDIAKEFGNLKNMILGGAIVTGVKEFAGTVLELEESTREYRNTMGSLKATIDTMEYGEEEMKAAYDRLYGVLGDAQTTATTLSNLMAVRTSEENIIELIDLATGAWSKYGDSIPIDGLAEAINETVRVGQVTGVFADVLNWGASEGETFGVMLKENIEFTELSKKELEKLTDAQREEYEATKEQYDAIEKYNEGVMEAKAAEDLFNIALQNAETEQERLALIMEAMSNGELDRQAKKWRELNEDVIAANDAQNRMEQSMARLGETVAPLANAIREFGADAIDWLVDKIERVIPVLEGMAEAAKTVWNAITGGKETDVYTNGQYGSRSVDGTHASGLAYVPFDGYLAELHAGEAVLTAAEADWWRSMGGGMPAQQSGVSVNDLQQIMTTAVNAINIGQNAGTKTIVLQMNVDGKRFYEETIHDFRAVDAANPEVKDDR